MGSSGCTRTITGTSGELEANPGAARHTGAERLFVWWLAPTAQKTVLLTPLDSLKQPKIRPAQRKEVDNKHQLLELNGAPGWAGPCCEFSAELMKWEVWTFVVEVSQAVRRRHWIIFSPCTCDI